MPRGLSVAALLTLLGLGAPLAHALVDVPTSERRALDLVDLACGSGIAPPADTAVLPLDGDAYLGAFRALKPLGLVDPVGGERDDRARARADGALHVESLVPRLEFRTYVLGGTDERLLYHTSGDVLHEGFNAFVSASGDAAWGQWLGGAYEVQLQESPGDFDATVKRLYLKARLGKWSFKVGRDTVHLGVGYHGSLLLDDNTAPLDLWQVRTEEPLFLPGFLSALGGFRFTLFNAYLSDEHPEAPDSRYDNKSGVAAIEDPRLLGMRLSYHPASWLDLGLSRTTLYGGKGRETYDTPQDWWELFTASNENVYAGQSHRYDNDQYAAVDATVRLPFLRDLGPLKAGKIYWEHAGTDFNAPWSSGGKGRFGLLQTANLGGLYLSTGATDLRAEFARTNQIWYAHNQYSQGFSYRGIPLGHHMGGDAQDLFLQLSTFLSPAWKVTAAYDREERGRSLPQPENRSEWSLSLEALGLRAFGRPLVARAEAVATHVTDPLDDADRDDRTAVYAGVTLSTPL